MHIKVEPYYLPDFQIFNDENEDSYFVWQPDKLIIVLGQSNKPEDSLNLEAVIKDRVMVTKRPSGGETVILSPKTIVVSALSISFDTKYPRYYFQLYNEKIIKTLSNLGIKNISHKGISDLAVNDKKILGSSIYRRKEKVFYHAVINYSETTDIIEKYLAHPKREPDYRKGRNHSDFVTSLVELGCEVDINTVIDEIKMCFNNKD